MVTVRKRKIKIEAGSSASSGASAGDKGAAKRRRKGLAPASTKGEGVKREVKSESKKGEEDSSDELLFRPRPRPRPRDHAAAGAGSGAGALACSGCRASVKREGKKEATPDRRPRPALLNTQDPAPRNATQRDATRTSKPTPFHFALLSPFPDPCVKAVD